jgi:hypothetical protein
MLSKKERFAMSDTAQPAINPAELINAKLQELGSDFVIASDLPRTWATGAQAFINPDFSMLIFREQNLLPKPPPSTDIVVSMKNVASVIMPTPIFLEFYQAIGTALEQLGLSGAGGDGDGAE